MIVTRPVRIIRGDDPGAVQPLYVTLIVGAASLDNGKSTLFTAPPKVKWVFVNKMAKSFPGVVSLNLGKKTALATSTFCGADGMLASLIIPATRYVADISDLATMVLVTQ